MKYVAELPWYWGGNISVLICFINAHQVCNATYSRRQAETHHSLALMTLQPRVICSDHSNKLQVFSLWVSLSSPPWLIPLRLYHKHRIIDYSSSTLSFARMIRITIARYLLYVYRSYWLIETSGIADEDRRLLADIIGYDGHKSSNSINCIISLRHSTLIQRLGKVLLVAAHPIMSNGSVWAQHICDWWNHTINVSHVRQWILQRVPTERSIAIALSNIYAW